MKKCQKFTIIYLKLFVIILFILIKFFIKKYYINKGKESLHINKSIYRNSIYLRKLQSPTVILESDYINKSFDFDTSSISTDLINTSDQILSSSQILDSSSQSIDSSSDLTDIFSQSDIPSISIDTLSISNSISPDTIISSSLYSDNLSITLDTSLETSSETINIPSLTIDTSSLIVDTSSLSISVFTSLNDISTTPSSDYINLSSEITTDNLTDILEDKNSTNSTDDNPLKKISSGLSTGEILAIVIPCIIFLIGIAILLALCTVCQKPPINNLDVSNNSHKVIQSSTDLLPIENTKSQPIQKVIVHSQAPMQNIYQIYPIKKVNPPIPKVNNVFQPIIPTQKIVTIREPVKPSYIQQFVEVEVAKPIKPISKINKVMEAPQISKIPEISHEEEIMPEIPSRVLPPKVLPEIHSSQIIESKVLPVKELPKITVESQVLPLKILPTLDLGNKITEEIEIIPYNPNVNNDIKINENESTPYITNVSEDIISNKNEDLPYITKVDDDIKVNKNESLPYISKVSDDIIMNENEVPYVTKEIDNLTNIQNKNLHPITIINKDLNNNINDDFNIEPNNPSTYISRDNGANLLENFSHNSRVINNPINDS